MKEDDLKEDDPDENSLLCRFVLDGVGKKIGESIATDGDLIIIKTRKNFLGVPIKHIEEEGKTLMVKGLIDQDKAEEMGEQWRKESFQDMDPPESERDGI